jgi:hypothetical protein
MPAASRLAGSGSFAWTMYSRADEFRIELVTFDASGAAHRRNPTALAAHAAPGVASLLAGSDHFRAGPSMQSMRAHLGDLAEYACREERDSAADPGGTQPFAVELVLHERLYGGDARETRAHRVCAP